MNEPRRFGGSGSDALPARHGMQQIDIVIASIAISLGNCTVVTTDTDLAAVPGLTIDNWELPAV